MKDVAAQDSPKTPLQFGKHTEDKGEAFVGINIKDSDGDTVYEYRPHWKQFVAHNLPVTEIFYGGAVFGGKTWWHLHHHMLHTMRWGNDANTVIFRRYIDDLKSSYILELQDKLQWGDGLLGKYMAGDMVMKWRWGGQTWFRGMEKLADRFKFASRQFTLISFDELTEFLQDQYEFMFLRMRSPDNADIMPQMLSSSNPRGEGHAWVRRRFIKGKEPGTIYRRHMPDHRIGDTKVPGYDFSRIFIPAKANDNKPGMENDDGYLGRMVEGMSQDTARAYLDGDWEFFQDKAYPEFDHDIHVCSPFNIPGDWKVIRAGDWGHSDPGYYGWMAHDPDDDIIYLFAEWYLMEEGPRGGIHGLSMTASDQRRKIYNIEQAFYQRGLCQYVWRGVMDPRAWGKAGEDENSVAELLNKKEILFEQANNDRHLGKQIFHDRLKRSPETGEPRFKVFSTCQNFIRTFDKIKTAKDDPEDTAKQGEDHPYDAVRYGLVHLETTGTPSDQGEGGSSDLSRLTGETDEQSFDPSSISNPAGLI